jgi:predicted phage terminase large subunit-like protein
MPGGAIIIIQTRWHQDDLAGWLLREHANENWDVLCLPAIAEQDEGFRKAGEPLWPERFPLPELEKIRMQTGGRAWASLYQQRPAAADGVIFKRDWWQFYSQPLSVAPNQIVQSWDTAFKKGEENDFSVCTTWSVASDGYYLLHLWRERVEFPELKRVVSSLAEQWKPNAILVEDKASGQSLIQELKLSTALPLIPVKVDSDKQTRAQAVTPLIEAGKVFLPESAPWRSDYIEEMACFPNGVHDDVVDATTQALNYFRVKPPLRASVLFPSRAYRKLDKEALWDKAMRDYPMSPEEIERM